MARSLTEIWTREMAIENLMSVLECSIRGIFEDSGKYSAAHMKNAENALIQIKEMHQESKRNKSKTLPSARATRNIDKKIRYQVFERAGFKCQACGARPKKQNDVSLHIDHIIPLSIGGGNEEDNLQCLCAECNLSKKNKYSVNHNKGWEDA